MQLKDLLDKFTCPAAKPIVLELDLARGLIEVRPNHPLQALQLLNATTMAALRDHLHQAATDERVAGLIVHAVSCRVSMATMDEVGELIAEFGKHKPTMAWSQSFGEFANSLAAYKLATAAHQIWLQPTGELGIGGLEANIVLAKGMLQKIGIEPQFGQRWEYKTAADQFAADEVTEANREMVTQLGQSVVDSAVATIAQRRGLSLEQVWQAVNDSPITAEQAKDLGLVDQLGYRDQVYAAALKQWDAEPEQLRFVHRYQPKGSLRQSLASRNAPKVGLVRLKGGIVTGRGNQGGLMGENAGADVVDEQLRAVLRDDEIKAVIFEIDSPGGSAVASDFIRRSVLRVKESGRPIIARMGGVAASGGYYAAMGCNEIIAQPTTITGSIGVVAGKFVTQQLYQRLGLKREPIRIGARAGMLSSSTEFSQADWDKLNQTLDRIYQDFTSFAAADRGMAYPELEALAKGRVWSGADAHRHGLIDHLGGQRLAWERACALAEIDPETAKPVRIGQLGLLERLMPASSSESTSASGTSLPSSAEELLVKAAAWLGLPIQGALSLPLHVELS